MPSARRLSIRSQNCRLASGSKPVVGSSRKTSSGPPRMPSATSRRRRWPPDSSRTRDRPLGGQADGLDDGVRVAWSRVVGAEVRDHLVDGQVGVVLGGLQDDADPSLPLRPAVGGVLAEHEHFAGGAVAVALEDLDRGCLPRAVGPEQGEDLAAVDLQVDPGDRLDRAVPLVQTSHGDRVGGTVGSGHGSSLPHAVAGPPGLRTAASRSRPPRAAPRSRASHSRCRGRRPAPWPAA